MKNIRLKPQIRLKSIIKSSSGMGIIEVLIAVTITATILTGIAILMSMSVRNAAEAAYRDEATDRSQEVMEYLQKHRVIEGWNDFYANMSDFDSCLYEGALDSFPPEQTSVCQFEFDEQMKAYFQKKLTMTGSEDSNSLTASVTVSWCLAVTSSNLCDPSSREGVVNFERIYTNF